MNANATKTVPRLLEGAQVTPTVRLVSPLDSGGMGAVWLAEHTGLKTLVVVKFMLDELGMSSSARSRFSREAAAAAKVKSPHVVQMLDHGLTDEGVPFIVMEHLEGRDLGDVLHAKGALPPDDVVAIVDQVAKALTRVHAAELLHRDIKPENIFLCDGDEIFVKLLDFGIAKSSDDVSLDTQTKTGQIVGTPFYMSPEQMMGKRDIDARSDLWALGVVAYECLTGKRPFDGPSFGAVAVNIATSAPVRPSEFGPGIPPAVDAWFQRACARELEHRFSSAKELADAFRRAFQEEPPTLSSAPATVRESARPESRPRLLSSTFDERPAAKPDSFPLSTPDSLPLARTEPIVPIKSIPPNATPVPGSAPTPLPKKMDELAPRPKKRGSFVIVALALLGTVGVAGYVFSPELAKSGLSPFSHTGESPVDPTLQAARKESSPQGTEVNAANLTDPASSAIVGPEDASVDAADPDASELVVVDDDASSLDVDASSDQDGGPPLPAQVDMTPPLELHR